jgi:Tfp pilus assembly protein PilF
MIARAASLLLLILLGGCMPVAIWSYQFARAGPGGVDDRIGKMLLDAEPHPEVKAVALYEAGRFTDAEPYAKEALERAEDPYFPEGSVLDFLAGFIGLDSPGLGRSLNDLAMVYEGQGRYAEAEPLLKRALAIRETALGPDHPDVATSLNNLAMVYEGQGRHAEAEPLFKRALLIREKRLGPDHPDSGASLNNLAMVYERQGRHVQAELLCQRALAIREKALGPDHPDVGKSLNNLASIYAEQGSYAEAERLYQRALAIREEALGPDHPDVGGTLNNIATTYAAQRRYAEAEPLFQRALAIREEALGPDHPDVGDTLNNFGHDLRRAGQVRRGRATISARAGHPKKALGRTDLTRSAVLTRPILRLKTGAERSRSAPPDRALVART